MYNLDSLNPELVKIFDHIEKELNGTITHINFSKMTELVKRTDNGQLVTTSLLIAQKFGKNHKDVLRAIRNLECSDEFHKRNFAPMNFTGGNKTLHHVVSKDGFSFLAMGFTGKVAAEFKEKFIAEFNRMEKEYKQQFAIPQTLSQALMLASKQAEQIELQQVEIKQLEPKAEFYDTVTDSKDTIDIGSVAKVLNLGIGRNKLFQALRENSILMNNNQPYQNYVDNGYFRVIESKFHKPDGSTHISLKTVVYQKGLDFIRKQLNK